MKRIERNKIIFLFCFVLALLSCNKNDAGTGDPLAPPKPMYDVTTNKLWAHRINTVEDALIALENFNGVETDIYFNDETNDFFVNHDGNEGLALTTFFNSIPQCSQYYFWLDFKNLSKENVYAAVKRMKYILLEFQLSKKVIIEHWDAELLFWFCQNNIFTSWTINDISADPFQLWDQFALRTQIKQKLRKYDFTSLSATHTMFPFLKKYFPEYNLHLWTNDLAGEADKEKIIEMAAEPGVKVILVDYDENFLKP